MNPTEFEGCRYELTRASDAEGLALEMDEVVGGRRELVLFAHYSDVGGCISFSAYRAGVPLEAVEWFCRQAREMLPPKPA